MPLRYVDFDKVQFCCFAATQALQCAELPQRVQCGCLYLAYSSCTCCETARSGGRELVILGYCIDAYGQLPRSQIVDYMLHSAATVRELLDLLERFAGKYLVFYSESDRFYIFTRCNGNHAVVIWHAGRLLLRCHPSLFYAEIRIISDIWHSNGTIKVF